MTLMAQRIWSCGCLPGSDCQVSSAEGGFRLVADVQRIQPDDGSAPKAVIAPKLPRRSASILKAVTGI